MLDLCMGGLRGKAISTTSDRHGLLEVFDLVEAVSIPLLLLDDEEMKFILRQAR